MSVFLGLGGEPFQTGVEVKYAHESWGADRPELTSSGLPDVALVAQGATTGQGVVSIIQDSSALAALGSGTGQTPYPGAEYMDIGLKVKATPALHPNNEVTLQLEFEIRALGGGKYKWHPHHFESHADANGARERRSANFDRRTDGPRRDALDHRIAWICGASGSGVCVWRANQQFD